MTNYTYDDPCPLCGGVVEVYANDTYKNNTMWFECVNDECEYEGSFQCVIENSVC